MAGVISRFEDAFLTCMMGLVRSVPIDLHWCSSEAGLTCVMVLMRAPKVMDTHTFTFKPPPCSPRSAWSGEALPPLGMEGPPVDLAACSMTNWPLGLGSGSGCIMMTRDQALGGEQRRAGQEVAPGASSSNGRSAGGIIARFSTPWFLGGPSRTARRARAA